MKYLNLLSLLFVVFQNSGCSKIIEIKENIIENSTTRTPNTNEENYKRAEICRASFWKYSLKYIAPKDVFLKHMALNQYSEKYAKNTFCSHKINPNRVPYYSYTEKRKKEEDSKHAKCIKNNKNFKLNAYKNTPQVFIEQIGKTLGNYSDSIFKNCIAGTEFVTESIKARCFYKASSFSKKLNTEKFPSSIGAGVPCRLISETSFKDITSKEIPLFMDYWMKRKEYNKVYEKAVSVAGKYGSNGDKNRYFLRFLKKELRKIKNIK